jgi:hypothetical protein
MTEKGNQNALKHGGEAGVDALEKGRDLTGPAALALEEVKADFAEGGAVAMIQGQAERLEAVSRFNLHYRTPPRSGGVFCFGYHPGAYIAR